MTRRQMAAGFVLAASALCATASPARPETAQPAPHRTVLQIAPSARVLSLSETLRDLAVTLAKVSVTCIGGNYLKAVIVATFRNLSNAKSADLTRVPWQSIIKADWNPSLGYGSLMDPGRKTIKPMASGPVLWRPGQTMMRTLTIHGIPKHHATATAPCRYGFAVRIDPKNPIAESDESNNARIAYAHDPCPH